MSVVYSKVKMADNNFEACKLIRNSQLSQGNGSCSPQYRWF